MRKELKRRAKENLKKHYLMVLVICLFASFCGVEYGMSTIRYHMDNIEYTSIGQLYETIVVNSDFKETVDRIANGEGDQVRKEIREQKEDLVKNDHSRYLGRSNGVFPVLPIPIPPAVFDSPWQRRCLVFPGPEPSLFL